MSIALEICVDNPQGLSSAVEGGADRIELCAALDFGGFTPAPGLVAQAVHAAIPVYAMIRPRAGNFCYSNLDEQAMMADIDAVRAAGLAGIVVGAAKESGALDTAMLYRLLCHAQGLKATLHRVFDLTPDPMTALRQAIDLGFERILTSGQALSAMDGIAMLEKLVCAAGDQISIMPGSGVHAENAVAILQKTGAQEIHASCRVVEAETDERCISYHFAPPSRRETSVAGVRVLKQLLDSL